MTSMPKQEKRHTLPPGHQLGRYRLIKVLGVGGFGVTYLGEHLSLGHMVAVKEYLPNEFAVREGVIVHPKSDASKGDYEWGLARFVEEARTLTKFRHPNLVRVSDHFKANNTAYIVMDYEDGQPLDVLLEKHGTLTEAQLKRIVLPVAGGLRQVHAAGFLHRDIKPANIFVRRADESPVLIDFGAARQSLGSKSKSMTVIASAGYSPPEQYDSQGEQGPWTDIYALGALCYRAITGKPPLDAPRRQSELLHTRKDPLPSLAKAGMAGYTHSCLKAVDWGLQVLETKRPQHLDEWVSLFKGGSTKQERGDKASPTEGGSSATWKPAKSPWKALWAGLCIIIASLALWNAFDPGNSEQPQRSGGATPTSPTPTAPKHEQARDYGTLTLTLKPADAVAQVRLPSRIGVYHYNAGMRLPAGRYILEVSRSGYYAKSQELVVRGGVDELRRIELAPLPQPRTWPFTVAASPSNAEVEFVRTDLAYRDGIRLLSGNYRVRVSALGYETKVVNVRHAGGTPTSIAVELSKTHRPFTIVTLPANAQVRIEGVSASYRDEMLLPWGDYRVRVSAPHHESKAIVVTHGHAQATRKQVVLDPTAAQTIDTPASSTITYFTRGSHKDDLQRLQGAPTSIQTYSSLGH